MNGVLLIPEWMFERQARYNHEGVAVPPAVAKDPAEVRDYCSTCGILEPYQMANGYIRRQCECKRRNEDREQQVAKRMTIWKQQQSEKAAKVYTWLGAGFSDIGLEDKTFANYQRDLQPGAYDAAIQFASDLRGNILFCGSWGTGKTHLVAAILNHLRSEHKPCLFTTAQNLFDALQNRIAFDAGYQDILTEASETGVLGIDDLDKLHLPVKTGGAFQRKVLFDILDKRYKRKLPTLITMNEDDCLPYIGDAAYSRLSDWQVGGLQILIMDGADYRKNECGG